MLANAFLNSSHFHSILWIYRLSNNKSVKPGPGVIKLFPCSTQLSIKLIMLINVKMPTIVGILSFVSMIKTATENLKARNIFIFKHFCFYERLKFHAQLS